MTVVVGRGKPTPRGRAAAAARAADRSRRRASRTLFLVVPLLFGGVDAAASLSVIGNGGRCSVDCTAGVLLLPFAPTVTPLSMAGIGDEDARISTSAAATAYVVSLALLVAWWRFLSGFAVRGDEPSRVRSRYRGRAWTVPRLHPSVVLLLGVLLTFALKVPALALDLRLGIGAAVLFELVAWPCVLWVLGSARSAEEPRAPVARS